jgi:ribosome biogenesis protein Nip4
MVGKSKGKRPLLRPRSRLKDNIKMDLKEIGWGDMDFIHLVRIRDRWQDFLCTVINLYVEP